jgi:hypothetical protein
VGHRGATVEHPGDARVLGQVTERPGSDNATGRRLGLTAENAEQTRLAGAVAADQPDLVPAHDGEVGRLDHEPAADLDRESLRLQHRSRLAARRAASNCSFARSVARASWRCPRI